MKKEFNKQDQEQFKLFQENEKRIEEEDADATNAVIPPIDMVAYTEQRSCADLYRMYEKNQLDINPDFQRGEVWSNRSQTLFIDSLKKQLPIPSMCISFDIKTKKRLVIDGLQRITSIIKFLNEKEDWKLAKIDDADVRLSGKKTSEIRENDSELIDIIENVTIPITVLRCDYSKSEHMKYLFQIFYRLNTGGNKLYNQEIRNCIFQGEFNTMLKKLARTKEWLTFANTTKEKVEKARLSNEERILRFFAFYYNYENYSGKFASFLNDYMDSKKNANTLELKSLQTVFDATLDIAIKLKPKIESKNVADAILVGISKNRDILKDKTDKELNEIYNQLLSEREFSQEELKEGLGAKEKIINRITKSISIFSRG